MTPEEKRAYEWAINQRYNSVAATYARVLARYIQRTSTPPACEWLESRNERAACFIPLEGYGRVYTEATVIQLLDEYRRAQDPAIVASPGNGA